MTIRPLKHTGDSSNLAFYAERGQPPGYVYAEVLRSDFERNGRGGLKRRRVPVFSITVRRPGTGVIGRFAYEPKTRPAPGPLSERTVTRLVRAALEAAP